VCIRKLTIKLFLFSFLVCFEGKLTFNIYTEALVIPDMKIQPIKWT